MPKINCEQHMDLWTGNTINARRPHELWDDVSETSYELLGVVFCNSDECEYRSLPLCTWRQRWHTPSLVPCIALIENQSSSPSPWCGSVGAWMPFAPLGLFTWRYLHCDKPCLSCCSGGSVSWGTVCHVMYHDRQEWTYQSVSYSHAWQCISYRVPFCATQSIDNCMSENVLLCASQRTLNYITEYSNAPSSVSPRACIVIYYTVHVPTFLCSVTYVIYIRARIIQ